MKQIKKLHAILVPLTVVLSACGGKTSSNAPVSGDAAIAHPASGAQTAKAVPTPNRKAPPGVPTPDTSSSLREKAATALEIIGPASAEEQARRAGLAQLRAQHDQFREADPERLKFALNEAPRNSDAIRAALSSSADNDLSRHLAKYLGEKDPAVAAANGLLVIDDLYASRDGAPSRFIELVKYISVLQTRGLYDQVVVDRINLLQAQLDQRGKYERWKVYGTVGGLIAAGAVTSYVLKGKGIDVSERGAAAARSVNWGRVASLGEEGLAQTAFRGTKGFMGRVGEFGRRGRMNDGDLAREILMKDLGLGEDIMNPLDIVRVSESRINYFGGNTAAPGQPKIEWLPTNSDRLQYFWAERIDGQTLEGQHALYLRVKRWNGWQPLEVAKYPNEVMNEINVKLARKVENLTAGGTYDIPADAAAAAASTARPKAERLGPFETPEFPGGRRPVPEADVKTFDHVAGAMSALKFTTITGGLSALSAYYENRLARDYENTHLERQVDRSPRSPEAPVSDLNAR